jgi:hypothetical protein
MKKLVLAVSLALASAGAVAESRGFITLEGESQNIHGTGVDVRSFNLIPGVKSGNLTYDLKVQAQSKDDHATSANIEPRVKYDYKIGMTDFTAWGRVGLGEKITQSGNYGYYTVEPGLSYAVLPGAKLSISNRYRDSFSDGKNYQTNTLYVGGTYDVNSFDTVGLKLYRSYNDAESNGVEFAYTRWF